MGSCKKSISPLNQHTKRQRHRREKRRQTRSSPKNWSAGNHGGIKRTQSRHQWNSRYLVKTSEVVTLIFLSLTFLVAFSWANTSTVYQPVVMLLFSACSTASSFKTIDYDFYRCVNSEKLPPKKLSANTFLFLTHKMRQAFYILGLRISQNFAV